MPTLFEEFAAAIGSLVAFFSSLAQEAWTRYLLIVFFFGLDNFVVTGITGKSFFSFVIEQVISVVFGIKGFSIPVYYGVNALFLLVVSYPLWVSLFWQMGK